MKNRTWIFFDVGSTLVDETQAYEQWARAAVEGASVSYAEFYETMLFYYRQGLRGDLEAARHYGLREPPWPSEAEAPYPDAAGSLQSLSRTHSIGIIANQSAGTAARLEAFGILRFIRQVVSSAEEGVSKPDERIFTLALERAGCRAEQAVMVGDRLDNDIAPANRLGMKTVWIKRGFGQYAKPRTKWEVPSVSISSLRELAGLL